VINSGRVPVEDQQVEKRMRGKGTGRNFFALSRDVWGKLWTIPTNNRLNLLTSYLVLLAGTGADHRLTKWSAKACEEYTGLGKPRAKLAIEELIAAKIIRHTDASTRMMPQYELPILPTDAEPIFLPVGLVTGLGGENPILRRVRETGDAHLLRMLIDLYGLVELDATHGVGLAHVYAGRNEGHQPTARKVAEVGSHCIWGVTAGTWKSAGGDWAAVHRTKGKDAQPWAEFWGRFDLLKKIGAISFEPWLFDGEAKDAEPIMPLDSSGFYAVQNPTAEAELTKAAFDAAQALVTDERSYLFERGGDFFVPLALHRQTPAYREVVKMRIEADTPGRRLAWKRRQALIKQYGDGFVQLRRDAERGEYGQPMRLGTRKGAAA